MRRFLKPALWTALVLVALIDVVLLIGYKLPQEHTASRSLVSRQPPQTVWAVITDHKSEPTWRPDLKKVEHLWDASRLEIWRETYSNGDSLSFATTELRPPERMVRIITDQNLPFGGRWEYDIVPEKDGGSRLTITEHGWVKPAFFRFVSKYIIGHTSTIDDYLEALAKKLGEPAEIS
ncbi:MAG: SRPBCC family protein [Acidobacteriales bacterium]|nr:SRPBCC family protein [Terriglobales bacterium]